MLGYRPTTRQLEGARQSLAEVEREMCRTEGPIPVDPHQAAETGTGPWLKNA
jgi:hypothetical protein